MRHTITLLCAALLVSCAASTIIESTWTDPAVASPAFGRVGVVALFDTVAESRTLEETAVRALEERGVQAIEAYSLLGDDRVREQEALSAALEEAEVDAILIYRVIAVDERNVYHDPAPYLDVPGDVTLGDPYYWYYHPSSDYYWYWRSTADVASSPGYWETLRYVIVESTLFDARRNRLVWSAKSATIDDAQFGPLAHSIVEAITDELVAKEVVAPRVSDRAAAAL